MLPKQFNDLQRNSSSLQSRSDLSREPMARTSKGRANVGGSP